MKKPKQAAFLAAFAETGSITSAAKAAKITRRLHYDWLEDPDYSARFDRAQEEAAHVLEDEAVRRATVGVEEPVMYQGALCYRQKQVRDEDGHMRTVSYGKPLAIRRYSDALMMFLLRGLRPDKYRERGSVELSGKNGAPIENAITVTFVKAQ